MSGDRGIIGETGNVASVSPVEVVHLEPELRSHRTVPPLDAKQSRRDASRHLTRAENISSWRQ
jgi:hypothetical protein